MEKRRAGASYVYSRAKGTADHYWPRAVFFPYAGQRTRRGRCPIDHRGEFPSVRGGLGPYRGVGAGGGVWGVEDWVLGGRGCGGQGSDALGGWSPGEDGTDGRSLVRSDGQTEIPPCVL